MTLAASLVSTLITCAAEVGGMGLIIHYLTGAPYLLMAALSTLAVGASMWILPFKWIERSYGLLGLLMLVFAAALIAIHPPWHDVAGGFVPQVPSGLSTKELLNFAYFGVAILSAVMFPYEAYFYSSGGIEEEWGPEDLTTNRVTSILGMALGSLLAIAILANSAQLFSPANVNPELPGSTAMQAAIPFGGTGLLLALFGMLFAVAGAAVETCMANAYSVAQFFGWEWGRHKKPWDAPRFTLAWIASAAVACAGSDRNRSADAGRICGAVLDPRASAHLSAADASRRRPQIYGRICERHFGEIPGLALFCDRHRRRAGRRAALPRDLRGGGMKPSGKLKLVSELLDLPIQDKDGRACGIVDDVELAGGRARRPSSRRCWSGPAPIAAECQAGLLPWSARSRAIA